MHLQHKNKLCAKVKLFSKQIICIDQSSTLVIYFAYFKFSSKTVGLVKPQAANIDEA